MKDEKCGCCGRVGEYEDVPGPFPGTTAKGLSGWVTFEGLTELVVDLPRDQEEDFLLPLDVAAAIHDFLEDTPKGLIRCARLGPEVTVAEVREVHSHWAGVVCPDCMIDHIDWDEEAWLWFLASKRHHDAGEDQTEQEGDER
jgi:hypothetical protein